MAQTSIQHIAQPDGSSLIRAYLDEGEAFDIRCDRLLEASRRLPDGARKLEVATFACRRVMEGVVGTAIWIEVARRDRLDRLSIEQLAVLDLGLKLVVPALSERGASGPGNGALGVLVDDAKAEGRVILIGVGRSAPLAVDLAERLDTRDAVIMMAPQITLADVARLRRDDGTRSFLGRLAAPRLGPWLGLCFSDADPSLNQAEIAAAAARFDDRLTFAGDTGAGPRGRAEIDAVKEMVTALARRGHLQELGSGPIKGIHKLASI